MSSLPGGVYLVVVKGKIRVIKTKGNEELFFFVKISLVFGHSLVVAWEA
jgi:hypothetical protein